MRGDSVWATHGSCPRVLLWEAAKWQHLKWVGKKEAWCWSLFPPCTGPQQGHWRHRGHRAGPTWQLDTGTPCWPCTAVGTGDATTALHGTRTWGMPRWPCTGVGTWGGLCQPCSAPGHRGHPHWASSGRNTPVRPGSGDTVPAPHSSGTTGVPTFGGHRGKDWGHGGGGAACSIPETRCRVDAPRGPCLSPGTAPGPASPARQGLKPAAASAP